MHLRRAEEEAPLEATILGEIGLGGERAGEPRVIAGALRVAREREDGGAARRLQREDLLDLLDGAGGLAELVLPDAGELLQQAHLAGGIRRDLRRLRVELEARAHAAPVAVGVARGGREDGRERLEHGAVAGVDGPRRAQVGDGLVAAAQVALGDVGRAEQRGDARGDGAHRVALGHPGAHPLLVPAEPLQRAVEPVARGDVVRVEGERALGVGGGLIRLAEAVEHLRQAHVLLHDGLRRGLRRGLQRRAAAVVEEEREPLLAHVRGLGRLAGDLQQADELGEDAPPGGRVQWGAGGRAREQVRGVAGRGRGGARLRVGHRRGRAQLVREQARGAVEEPRGAVVVALVLGLDRERADQDAGLVVAHQVARERVAHGARRGLEGDGALQREARHLRLGEAQIEHGGALDVDPGGEAGVAVRRRGSLGRGALARGVRLREALEVGGELRGEARRRAGGLGSAGSLGRRSSARGRAGGGQRTGSPDLPPQHRLQPPQGRRVQRRQAERLDVGRARLGPAAERVADASALGEEIGLEPLALDHGDLVVEDLQRERQLPVPLEQPPHARERRLQRAQQPARRFVRGARRGPILRHPLLEQAQLDEGARRAHRVAGVAQALGATAQLRAGAGPGVLLLHGRARLHRRRHRRDRRDRRREGHRRRSRALEGDAQLGGRRALVDAPGRRRGRGRPRQRREAGERRDLGRRHRRRRTERDAHHERLGRGGRRPLQHRLHRRRPPGRRRGPARRQRRLAHRRDQRREVRRRRVARPRDPRRRRGRAARRTRRRPRRRRRARAQRRRGATYHRAWPTRRGAGRLGCIRRGARRLPRTALIVLLGHRGRC